MKLEKVTWITLDAPSGCSTEMAMFILDGSEVKNFECFDTNTILSINIVTGQNAIAQYGDKAKHGVIIIKTKTPKEKQRSLML